MTDGVGVADSERRALLNAQGALAVVSEASESVDDGLGGIDERTREQSDALEAVLGEVSELHSTVEELAATAGDVDDRADTAASRAEEGYEAAKRAGEDVAAVHEAGSSVETEIDRLAACIEDIETALSGIDDIAEQTNMLALNASIEAARADGDSDGFAVVAEEIKSLAAESQSYADRIGETLADVRAATDATLEELETLTDAVEASAARIDRSAEALGDVDEAMTATAEDVSTVAAATDEQAAVSESIAGRVERAVERANGIETDVADIRGARAEQTAMLAEIRDTVERATPALAPEAVEVVPTGLEPLDERVGGLIRGGRAVLRYQNAGANAIVARMCETALQCGLAVSLTPPPGLDARRLERELSEPVHEAREANRLFVLDAFDQWPDGRNVFDLRDGSLSAINRQTATRREKPLLIVGTIEAEIGALGERAAREARYENDAEIFEPTDTVLNVVDDGAVGETFGAFYAGAADQVFELADGRVIVRTAPAVENGTAVDLRQTAVSP